MPTLKQGIWGKHQEGIGYVILITPKVSSIASVYTYSYGVGGVVGEIP